MPLPSFGEPEGGGSGFPLVIGGVDPWGPEWKSGAPEFGCVGGMTPRVAKPVFRFASCGAS